MTEPGDAVAEVAQRPDPGAGLWRRWWVAARPKTLGAAITPVMIGCALAARMNSFPLGVAAAALVTALLIQVGTNFANDLFDFRRGADTAERLGPPRAVQSGLVTPEEMGTATAITLGAAAAVGLYLVRVGGLPILVIGLTGIVAGVLYTAGPRPLAYLGLGDVFVWTHFGIAAVAGTVYLLTGLWDQTALVLGGATGAFAVAVLTINNIRDLRTDAKVGKRTLAVRLGDHRARRYCAALLAIGVLAPTSILAIGGPAPVGLAGLLAVPLAWPIAREVLAGTSGRALNPLLSQTVRLQAVHGGLLVAALLATA